jgi:hypothetical protein
LLGPLLIAVVLGTLSWAKASSMPSIACCCLLELLPACGRAGRVGLDPLIGYWILLRRSDRACRRCSSSSSTGGRGVGSCLVSVRGDRALSNEVLLAGDMCRCGVGAIGGEVMLCVNAGLGAVGKLETSGLG